MSLSDRIGDIARRIMGEPNRVLSTCHQLRFGNRGSLAVEIGGPNAGTWFDHELNQGGGTRELIRVKGGVADDEINDWLKREGFAINPNITSGRAEFKIVAAYDYHDEYGRFLFQVCRLEPKNFVQRRPNGGGWIWKTRGIRRVPYRLPELLASAAADAPVYIVEGEKDVGRLAALGLVATCNPGGAAKRGANGKPSKPKWTSDLNKHFAGRRVIVLPDNDEAGTDHAEAVAKNLAPSVSEIRILRLPDLLHKGDVSDWLDSGGTREELERLAAEAPTFQSPEPPKQAGNGIDGSAEIARLAKLSVLQYERERTDAAEKFGCRASVLDRLVNKERGPDDVDKSNGGQGQPLEFPEIDPWPAPVDGAELLGGLSEAIRSYVIITQAQADVIALWVIFTHAFEAFDFSPKLAVTSPEKRSGKTRLAEALERLVRRPLFVSGINPAALLRVIAQRAPSMLIDEFDALMKGDAHMAEMLRGLLNSGFTRAAARFVKNVPLPDGGFEPRAFSTWCPRLLAGIGKLPDTVADRSIVIAMKRKRPDEKVRRLRARDGGEFHILARKATRWAADNVDVLKDADPEVPKQLNDRAADAWSPLFAIADLAGGAWPHRARKTALELSGGNEGTETTREMLLGDLRELFEAEKTGVLFSREILAALAKREDRPWSEWKAGKPITGRQLAALMKPLGITTNQTIRRGNDDDKGYRSEWFEDAFARYLPNRPSQSVTRSQVADSVAFGDFRSATRKEFVTDGIPKKPSVSAGCDCVTDKIPDSGRADAGLDDSGDRSRRGERTSL